MICRKLTKIQQALGHSHIHLTLHWRMRAQLPIENELEKFALLEKETQESLANTFLPLLFARHWDPGPKTSVRHFRPAKSKLEKVGQVRILLGLVSFKRGIVFHVMRTEMLEQLVFSQLTSSSKLYFVVLKSKMRSQLEKCVKERRKSITIRKLGGKTEPRNAGTIKWDQMHQETQKWYLWSKVAEARRLQCRALHSNLFCGVSLRNIGKLKASSY